MRLAVPNVRFRKVQFKALVTAADPSRGRGTAYEFSSGKTFKEPLRTTGPAPVSAAVLSSGTVLRVTYNKAIEGGSALTGFSWATGALSSASYSGVTHDFVIAKVYDDDDIDSIVYASHRNGLYGNGHPVASYSMAVTNGSTQKRAPTPATAIILADGYTLDVTFDYDLTVAATTGLTRSTSSITSASLNSGDLRLEVPYTLAAASAGTLTYDGLGDLYGNGADVAAFGPLAITNNSTLTGTWSTVGSALSISRLSTTNRAYSLAAMSATRLAVAHGDDATAGTGTIKIYDHNGTTWSLFASLSMSYSGNVSIAYIGNDTLAWYGADLRSIKLTGSTLAQVGSTFSRTRGNANNDRICRMADNSIAMHLDDAASFEGLSLLAWDAGALTWSQVGNTLDLAGIVQSPGLIEMTAFSATRVLLMSTAASYDEAFTFTHDGTSWSLTTSGNYTQGAIYGCSSMNGSDFAFVDNTSGNDYLRMLRITTGSPAMVGTAFALSTNNDHKVASMSRTRAAVVEDGASTGAIQMYQWA